LKHFFHIAYKGNNYHGWQRQSRAISVQQVIEDALSRILKEPVAIMGCGRTDTQVHASQYFFHLEVMRAWDFDLLYRLNRLLPPDIAVFEIIPVADNQHARFDAMQRTYNYFLHTYKDPFLSGNSALYVEPNLRLNEMQKAVKLLTTYNDYKAFCRTPASYKHTICHVSSALLFTNATGDRIRFQISANRFLAHMVRLIMGGLLEIGRGRWSVDQFEDCFSAGALPDFIKPAYPQGLYLSRVQYRYLDIPARTTFLMPELTEAAWIEVE
jgi:tRNA pseudouridine38-40 synthase